MTQEMPIGLHDDTVVLMYKSERNAVESRSCVRRARKNRGWSRWCVVARRFDAKLGKDGDVTAAVSLDSYLTREKGRTRKDCEHPGSRPPSPSTHDPLRSELR